MLRRMSWKQRFFDRDTGKHRTSAHQPEPA
jgi:hypothetical protein